MLNPIIAVLRKEGIPFHNPYRKSCDLWNPLQLGRRDAPVNRILALLSQPQTYGALKQWTECVRPNGVLKAGAKALIDAADDSKIVTTEQLKELLESSAIQILHAACVQTQLFC